jgi:YD repeat-containing protein
MTVAGQAQVVYGYDDANRLTTITQGSPVVTFGYDAANRRTSLTLPNGVVVEYAYDAASRLTGGRVTGCHLGRGVLAASRGSRTDSWVRRSGSYQTRVADHRSFRDVGPSTLVDARLRP